MRKNIRKYLFISIIIWMVFCSQNSLLAESLFDDRRALYEKTEALTQVPWYYLAAINQYERNIHTLEEDQLVGIQYPEEKWYGLLAGLESKPDFREETLSLFQGKGKDGSGDGVASYSDPEDVLYTVALHIQEELAKGKTFEKLIEEFYDREKAGLLISQYAKMFHHFKQVDLSERAFPLPTNYNYSYRSTWGHGRGYGGRRIHEGTDLFASYGTPVRSSSYGIVEIKGWNKFGGWRVGIRDAQNIYHYYAHLHGFEEGIEEGSFVEPGEVIGYVGSSGYGPVGTAGKFPPHLHYGMYRDNGTNEWAFDPYPYLRHWE
ncbi:M23 family metallopeptidase [Halalkalibacillus halophilus]|uniref:M23 family metallopeptidase n=1 Tax=Halalkalibacillus halophilus TaxID=392827 RepID=UPI00040A7573|nr:M23 family metallopeptidase [Halalkalibacillus halophilus]